VLNVSRTRAVQCNDDDDVMWRAGHGARFWPGVWHVGTNEDQTARANDGRRRLPSQTASAPVWRLHDSPDVDACLFSRQLSVNTSLHCLFLFRLFCRYDAISVVVIVDRWFYFVC